jgi:hypothetical protein
VATATNASGNLSTNQSFYSSGSFATVTLTSSNATQGVGGAISVDFLASCAPITLKVNVADSKGNPMPEGTAITALSPSQGTVAINPATVKYTGAEIKAATGGTPHDVVITPATSCTGSGNAQPGAFDLSVKSPLGSETLTHVAFTFKAP